MLKCKWWTGSTKHSLIQCLSINGILISYFVGDSPPALLISWFFLALLTIFYDHGSKHVKTLLPCRLKIARKRTFISPRPMEKSHRFRSRPNHQTCPNLFLYQQKLTSKSGEISQSFTPPNPVLAVAPFPRPSVGSRSAAPGCSHRRRQRWSATGRWRPGSAGDQVDVWSR